MAFQKKKPTKKLQGIPKKYHVKKGDTVMIIAGGNNEKRPLVGKTGTVKRVLRSEGKVIVEGLNMVKKAVKPNPMIGQRGGIVEVEAPIAIGRVMVYDLKAGKPTRVKRQEVDGKRVRVSVKSGEQLDS